MWMRKAIIEAQRQRGGGRFTLTGLILATAQPDIGPLESACDAQPTQKPENCNRDH
jgi:hypothetical protein